MNHLVSLDAMAGGLEKILSGAKIVLVKIFDSAHTSEYPICQGDGLYLISIYGMHTLVIFALLILRDLIWRGRQIRA